MLSPKCQASTAGQVPGLPRLPIVRSVDLVVDSPLAASGLGDRTRQVRINVVEVERVDADAYLLAEYIAQQLEKRVAFRRTIRMALQRAQRAGVLGLKVQVGGRLNGAEIARTEWTREGRVPLQKKNITKCIVTSQPIHRLLSKHDQGIYFFLF